MQSVEDGLSAGNTIDVDDDRRLCNPNRQRSDIRHSFVECARGFRVAYGLVKELGEIIEQGVLLFDGQRQNPVEKSWNIEFIFLTDLRSTLLNQSDVLQGLSWIFQAGNRLICQNPSIHQAERRSTFGSLKVVASPIGVVGGPAVALGQCAQASEAPRNGGAKALLPGQFRTQEYVFGRFCLVASVSPSETLHLLVCAPAQFERDVHAALTVWGAIRGVQRNAHRTGITDNGDAALPTLKLSHPMHVNLVHRYAFWRALLVFGFLRLRIPNQTARSAGDFRNVPLSKMIHQLV